MGVEQHHTAELNGDIGAEGECGRVGEGSEIRLMGQEAREDEGKSAQSVKRRPTCGEGESAGCLVE